MTKEELVYTLFGRNVPFKVTNESWFLINNLLDDIKKGFKVLLDNDAILIEASVNCYQLSIRRTYTKVYGEFTEIIDDRVIILQRHLYPKENIDLPITLKLHKLIEQYDE